MSLLAPQKSITGSFALFSRLIGDRLMVVVGISCSGISG